MRIWDYFVQFWVRRLSHFSWLILLVALALTGLSVYVTVDRLGFQTRRSDLISSDQHLMAIKKRLEQEFGDRDGLVVVVASPEKRGAIAFAEALAQELRKYPDDFPELFYRVDPKGFQDRALYFLKSKELRQLQDKILSHEKIMKELAANPSLTRFFQTVNQEITRSMIGHLFTGFLEEKDKEKLPDLSLLNASLQQLSRSLENKGSYSSPFNAFFPRGLGDLSEEGYFFTKNDKYLLFLITPRPGDYTASQRSLNLLRKVIVPLRLQFPEVQAGVTGPEALEDDEMAYAQTDIILATWLSLVGQFLLLIVFFRSLKRSLVEVVVLLIGLCWTFGLTTLVVGHLNILSMIFAPLMLGIAIDFGIHWFCRLEEEQGGKAPPSMTNLFQTQKYGGPAIAFAALASALCFLPLVFTGFKGLAELGLIMFMGLTAMIVVTLLVQPALLMLVERCQPGDLRDGGRRQKPHPFILLKWQRPGVIAALGLGLMAIAVMALFRVPFNLNPLDLQNPKTESVVWEHKLLQNSRYTSAYAIMTGKSLEEVKAKTRALKSLGTVSQVESILSFLPENPQAKQHLFKDMEATVGPLTFAAGPGPATAPGKLAAILRRIHFKLATAKESDWAPESQVTQAQLAKANLLLSRLVPLLEPKDQPQAAAHLAAFEKRFFADLKEKWQLLQDNLRALPLKMADLPRQVQERFVSPQGTYIIRIFPAQDIWDMQILKNFVQDLRKVDPDVVGDPVLLYVFNSAFLRDCLWATGIGLLAIIFLALPLYRNLTLSLLALVPLFFGLGLTLNLMWLLGISFNQANVIFLPLLLGQSVEFGIIILTRWQLEKSARALTLPASTAKGVALAALTTTVGFGSLMVSGHRGVFSLGLLATVGSLSVLIGAFTVFPALLRLWEQRKSLWVKVFKPLAIKNPGPFER
jgi:hopanoid biosynthesis associated RND transporter like protein HpnN